MPIYFSEAIIRQATVEDLNILNKEKRKNQDDLDFYSKQKWVTNWLKYVSFG